MRGRTDPRSQGDIVASVGISSPVTRLQTRGIARAAAEVKKTADAISASLPADRIPSDLVVQHDRIILLRFHRPLDQRPHALVAGRRDPLLPELLALELELEAVVVRGGRGALDERAALQHLHADVSLVLDRFGNERVVKGVEHLALARGRDVHFHVEPDVLRLRPRRRREAAEAECGGRRARMRTAGFPVCSMSSRISPLPAWSALARPVSNCVFAATSLATPITNSSSGAEPVLVN